MEGKKKRHAEPNHQQTGESTIVSEQHKVNTWESDNCLRNDPFCAAALPKFAAAVSAETSASLSETWHPR
jgi:hypothetical protein